MPTLLHLDSSPLETSISRELGREFVKTWKAAHPDGHVIYRDLAASALKPIDTTWIYSNFTPAPSRSEAQISSLALSEELIHELEQADEYAIGVAMHNFSIPSVLKLWIDQIARSGRTFSYGEYGPRGLLEGKKATVLVASGGVYEQGTPAAAFDFIEPYLKAVLGFIGVANVKFVNAGGTREVYMGEVSREVFLQPLLERVREVVG
jgi:FMN-dependent NADH-azoreductase